MEFRGTQTCFLSQYINFIEVSRVGRSQNGRNASHASGITCHLFSFLLCPVISNYPKTGLPRDPRMTSMFRRHDICHVFPFVAGRWASLRRIGDATLGGSTTLQNSKPSRKCRQSSLRPSSREEGIERRLRLENLSYFG